MVLIVFLGESFSAARAIVRELLPGDEIRGGAADRLPSARVDVLVPAMSRLDAAVMDAAQPRLIQLAALRPRGVVVNVGRGPVVDYEALLAALRSGSLAGAGLDVFWREPIDPDDPILRENVFVTPHIGGATRQAGHQTALRFVANVERLRRGEPIQDRAA